MAGNTLLRWSDGIVSAIQVVETMRDAVFDGLEHPMVGRLNSLRPSQHAHNDLVKLLEKDTMAIGLVESVPGARAGDAHAPSSMVRPSAYIAALRHYSASEFARRLGCDRSRLRVCL